MVGSEFGANGKNPWTQPALRQQSRCGAVNVFLVHFGLLIPINHRLNATAYLSIVADHMLHFMQTIYHLLMIISSMTPYHKGKVDFMNRRV